MKWLRNKDKSAMVRTALARLQREFDLQQLKESAELYAELYEDDAELQDMTDLT
jgi:hypothetical protein